MSEEHRADITGRFLGEPAFSHRVGTLKLVDYVKAGNWIRHRGRSPR